ncbi:lipopolysaccharide biosynthesis protein [Mucilaginibacter sp. UYCu711]|uniref:lipopolysaccharide biosynthesis protein n=1 Tax=Mucilaginibacter sp. UYCu711 TaxID=3156339 RepID=UPI003D24777D
MVQHNIEQVNNDPDKASLKDLILKLKEWWLYLLSKWVIILIVGLLGGAIGVGYAYSKKPVYEAALSFALEDDKSGGVGPAAGLASQFGIDLGGSGGGAFAGDNLLGLMKSRSIVEKTLLTPIIIYNKKQTLAQYYIAFNKYRKSWDDKPKLKGIDFQPGADRTKFNLQQDSILGTFYNDIVKSSLSVDKVDKKLSIITIKVHSPNELFAKYFAEVLAKTVSDFYVDTKTRKSVQNVQILQKQVDSIRRELNSAITGAASSADFNPNPNPSLQVLRAPTDRRKVDVQANTAILTELVKNLEISKISLRKETPLIQVIDSPILPLDKTQLSKRNSLMVGGILAGMLICVFLILKKILTDILR